MNQNLDVHRALSGAHLLVTGATGFLGKVFVAMLLERVPGIGRITLVVRGGESDPRKRVETLINTSPAFRSLRTSLGARLPALLRATLDVVEGDVSEPLCGISSRELAAISESVDLVVHVAGLTDFDPDPVQAVAINVRGAGHAADVAARTQRARFLHISTCFVVGNAPGSVSETVPSKTLPSGESLDSVEQIDASLDALMTFVKNAEDTAERRDHKALKRIRAEAGTAFSNARGYPNLYTFSKSLAERALAMRTDISLVIARPSIVECALSYPFAGWNEGLNTSGPLVWLLATPFRELPAKADNHFDVVPVDLVAQSMITLCAAHVRNEVDGVYQIASSDHNPLTVGRAIELTSLGARRHHLRGDASKWERTVFRYLDAVPVDADRPSPFSVSNLRQITRSLRDAVEKTDLKKVLPESVHAFAGEVLTRKQMEAHMHLSKADVALRSIDRMLKLYRPFTHDNDWVFRTDRMRALAARLSEKDARLFGFDVRSYDWRSYWLDVQWPGLAKWCLPLIEGKVAPVDPEPANAFKFASHGTTSHEASL